MISTLQWVSRRLLLALGICTVSLQAQVPTAVLTGVVKDSTGAVVPNVRVTAINAGTNLSRSAVTNELSTYRIAPLNPGPYNVEAEASDFKKATVPEVNLEVD